MKKITYLLLPIICLFSFNVFPQTTYDKTEPSYQMEMEDITTRIIDQNKPVFSIPASIDLNNGQARYNVAINIPKGINGFTPTVSIGYNSNSGNGLLGWGWHLHATSSINRIPAPYLIDHKVSPVEFDATDILALDGQPIVCDNGSLTCQINGGDVYETLVESYQRIEKLSSGGFLVEQKDGTRRYYGTTSDTRVEVTHNGSIVVASWLLDYILDRSGNRVSYDYEISSANNEYRLNEINYIGESGTPLAVIEFHYSHRTDIKSARLAGHTFESDILLREIRSTYNGTEYSRYQFKYFWRTGITGDDFSRLNEIQYSGLNGTDVNSTLVQWFEPSQESTFSTSINPNFSLGSHPGMQVLMDINGDGLTDILTLELRSYIYR